MKDRARSLFYPFMLLLGLFWLEVSLHRVFGGPYGSFLVPQFVVLFVMVLAVWRDLKEALFWSFVAGFMGELFSGLYFGTFMFFSILVTVIIFFVTRKVTSQDVSISTGVAVVGLAVVLFPVCAWAFNAFISGLGIVTPPPLPEYFTWKLGLRLVVNFISFFPINRLFKGLSHEQTQTV